MKGMLFYQILSNNTVYIASTFNENNRNINLFLYHVDQCKEPLFGA